MDNSVQIPLDLPDVRVLGVSKTEEGDWLIRVESTLGSTRLPLLWPPDEPLPWR